MKALILGTTAALAFTVGLAAQSSTTKTETKVDVKDGKDVTVTGCVEASETGAGYVLTHVEPRVGDPLTMFTLVGQESSVGRHLGHLVEIKGKATNVGDDGKVEVTTKTKVEREDGDDTVTKSKSEIEGPAAPAYLGVRSVKTLRTSCW
ncbi:MAG TPA: hypothetical protein VJ260_11140 [Vicinamibacterales bacterium]|jgi:hypothetical protein|nr:hypothetical protein [Vicinamibacterales bacterium]